MSNYYVSKCCNKEAKYLSAGQDKTIGQCTNCFEMSELTKVIDGDFRRVDLGSKYNPVNHDGFIQ